MASSPGKVLILGAGTRAFLAIVRSLGRRGMDVHVGWCPPGDAALRSRYISRFHQLPVPSSEDERWKSALAGIMQEERFDLVIPCDDPTILPLHAHREDLERYGRLYLLDERAFEVTSDKIKTYELAHSLGLPVGSALRITDPSEGELVAEQLGFPLVLKPRASFSVDDLVNRNYVRIVYDLAELRRSLDGMCAQGDVLVQAYFAGTGAGVEVLADRGAILFAFQHLRVHEPRTGGGSSYRKSVPLQAEMVDATAAVLRALNYTGVAMMEFRVNLETHTWMLIEVNGRFWGSLPLAVAAGADFPFYLYELLVHDKHEFPQTYRTGLYSRHIGRDIAWMIESFKADKSTPARRASTLRQVAGEALHLLTLRERNDTLVMDDPRPGLAEVGGLVRAVSSKALRKARSLVWRVPAIRDVYRARARRSVGRARNVLFVCKGNICRSPFAEYYARSIFPAPLQVSSCGYYPKQGRLCPDEALIAAREVGIDLSPHRSRIVTEEAIRRAEVVFTFDQGDRAALLARFPAVKPKLHLLGLLAPGRVAENVTIEDPVGKDLDHFRRLYRGMAAALDACRSTVPAYQQPAYIEE